MKDKSSTPQFIHPLEIYIEHLTTINDVPLTQREIDVLACLLNGRSRQGIANFLSISPKTIDSHVNNITHKFGCNSVSLITLLENSVQFLALKEYYLALLIDTWFKKFLEDIAKLAIDSHIPVSCVLVYWHKKPPFLEYLENDLTKAGLSIFLENRKDVPSLYKLTQEIYNDTYLIYFLPETLTEEGEIQKAPNASEGIEKFSEGKIFFLSETDTEKKRNLPQEIHKFTCINASEWSSYYFSVFVILKKILPTFDLDEIYAKFEEKATLLQSSLFSLTPQSSSGNGLISANTKHNHGLKIGTFLLRKKLIYYSLAGLLCMGILFFAVMNWRGVWINHAINVASSSVQSDLIIPTDSTLLNRSQLIEQVDNFFQQPSLGIQTIAIIGIGGSGKTTLARQYARSQKLPVTWEINAETKERLSGSFEKLAQALASTEDDQKILRVLQEIKDPAEKEDKIICFVKNRLKSHKGWFLIYDNVENFHDIQKYFPQDSNKWGVGKVILTTRNSNVHNNSAVSQAIQIGDLSNDQKLKLFIQIMNHGENKGSTAVERESAIQFLEKIPPFPLDISVAAYYLKTTKVPYTQYLENFNQFDKDFTAIEENLLKEVGEYAKTRYGIITLSLKQLIDTHKDFGDLLLFISLLDSQNIPRELLNLYKNDVLVDNFIYHLKKYSFITHESSVPSIGFALSIHRSTQAIVLDYLVKRLDLKINKKLINSIANTFESYLENIIDQEDVCKMKLLERHCNVLLKFCFLLNDSAKSAINGVLGSIYSYFGDYLKAEKFLKKSIVYLNDEEEHNNRTAWNLGRLGDIYSEIGKYKEAKYFLEKSIMLYKKSFSKNHNKIIRGSSNLGYVYKELGEYKKATKLLEQNLVSYRMSFPDDHLGIVWTLLYLGYVYQDIGNYPKAKNFLAKGLMVCENYLPKDHITAAWILTHLGVIQLKLGNVGKARNLVEQALKICKIHFSDNHTGLAVILGHLGEVHKELGNYKEAQLLFEKSLAIFKKHYVRNHIRIALTSQELAKVYFLEAQIETAEVIFKNSAALLKENNHPLVYIISENFAELHLKKSQIVHRKGYFLQSQAFKTQAINDLKNALDVVKTHFPEDSSHRIRIQDKLKRFE